jgi:hypothetical protein
MFDFTNFFTSDGFELGLKIFALFLIGFYMIFALIVFNHIRSLRRILVVSTAAGSPLIQTMNFFYLLATIFLFVLALVIL